MEHIDTGTFGAVMGRLPTGVVAVSGMSGPTARPDGLVVGVFQSLSLEPPMVTFSAGCSSTSWPRLRRLERLCASVLAVGQEGVSHALSSRRPDKFASVPWTLSGLGTPHIEGAHVWIDCEIEYELREGDHMIVIAHAVHVEAGDGEPLVLYRGELGGYRGALVA